MIKKAIINDQEIKKNRRSIGGNGTKKLKTLSQIILRAEEKEGFWNIKYDGHLTSANRSSPFSFERV